MVLWPLGGDERSPPSGCGTVGAAVASTSLAPVSREVDKQQCRGDNRLSEHGSVGLISPVAFPTTGPPA